MSEEVSRKLRVLVVAEAANPEWPSVPLVGWSHTRALKNICDVHLATQVRNRDAIVRAGWQEGRDFTAINSEKLAAPLNKLAFKIRGGAQLAWTAATALESLTYPYFEHLVWKHFEDALKKGEFDLVHRITPVSPTAPSVLAKRLAKINVPFVVGPINGGVAWPSEFRDLQHREKEWLSHVRSVYKLLPGYRGLRRYASAMVAGSMATKSQLPQKYSDKTFYLPENAIDPERFSLCHQGDYSLPLRAAFVGRLVPYKGADMAIDAMAPLVKAGKMRYDIYGSGPEESSLREQVKALGLEDGITVHGFIPNDQLQAKLVEADLLVFPSIREFGGGVVLEAMALGLVPVIADYAGPAELVTDDTGYKIAMGKRDVLVENFRRALNAICDKPDQLAEKKQAALARVNRYYTWKIKAEQMQSLYRWVLDEGKKPDFQIPFPD